VLSSKALQQLFGCLSATSGAAAPVNHTAVSPRCSEEASGCAPVVPLRQSQQLLQQLRSGQPVLADSAARLSARELVDTCKPAFLASCSAAPDLGVRWLEFIIGVLQLPSGGLVLPEVADAAVDASAVLRSLVDFELANPYGRVCFSAAYRPPLGATEAAP
jgi:hypothetical protein